ncbi:unnamed protein product, partial [Polarella glacialis]
MSVAQIPQVSLQLASKASSVPTLWPADSHRVAEIRDQLKSCGLAVVDGIFSDDGASAKQLKDYALDLYSSGCMQAGVITEDTQEADADEVTSQRVDPSDRGDFVCWLRLDGTCDGDEDTQKVPADNVAAVRSAAAVLCTQLALRICNLVRQSLDEQLAPSLIMTAVYPPGQGAHFREHLDNPNGDGRLLTAVYYVNDGWAAKDGALLRAKLPRQSREDGTCHDCQVRDIIPRADRLVLFQSDRVRHEVTPNARPDTSASAHRCAFTIWFFREDADAQLEPDECETSVDEAVTRAVSRAELQSGELYSYSAVEATRFGAVLESEVVSFEVAEGPFEHHVDMNHYGHGSVSVSPGYSWLPAPVPGNVRPSWRMPCEFELPEALCIAKVQMFDADCDSDFESTMHSESEAVHAEVCTASLNLCFFGEMYFSLIRSDGRLGDLDSRLGVVLSDLELQWQADRTDRQADSLEVRSDLDRQWEELSKGLIASTAEVEERAQKEQREVLDALAAVCNDIESLRMRQQEQQAVLEDSRNSEEPLAMAAAAGMVTSLSRMSADLEELRGRSGQQRGAFESLKAELQKMLMEELQARRISELEALQSEDSRHRRDIDALREQSSRSLEALRSEEASRRDVAETQLSAELQVLRTQLSSCMQAVSESSQRQEQHSQAAGGVRSEQLVSLAEQLRSELAAEAARVAERLSADVSAVRSQLAEGLADVRSQQGRQRNDFEALRTDCERSSSSSSSTARAEPQPQVSSADLNASARRRSDSCDEGQLRREDLEAFRTLHSRDLAEIQGRLGLQGREIESLQSQVLDTSEAQSKSRQRLTGEIEALRKDTEKQLEKDKASEWSLLKAFQQPLTGGCRGQESDAGEPCDTVQTRRPTVRQQADESLSSDVDVLRAKQVRDAQELRSQQRSFFDDLSSQAEAARKQLASELEAVRSHCNAGVSGLQTQQSNTLEVMRSQQKRAETIQSQLLGDIGAIKMQL